MIRRVGFSSNFAWGQGIFEDSEYWNMCSCSCFHSQHKVRILQTSRVGVQRMQVVFTGASKRDSSRRKLVVWSRVADQWDELSVIRKAKKFSAFLWLKESLDAHLILCWWENLVRFKYDQALWVFAHLSIAFKSQDSQSLGSPSTSIDFSHYPFYNCRWQACGPSNPKLALP